MKYRFPKVNSLGRDMLAKSGVVICAFTEYVVRPPAAAEDGGTPPVLETKYVNKWAHVGYNDLVPRAIQAHILSATDGAVLSFDFNVERDVLLEMNWHFQNAWEFVRELDKTCVWYLRFFGFAESPRLVGSSPMSLMSYLWFPGRRFFVRVSSN